MGKSFVCACEDLTVDEVEEAILHGASCFEDLKRTIGVATGPCQGKACVAACARLLSEKLGGDLTDDRVITYRPPLRPIPLGLLAGDDNE